jgi:hypothetical protein
MTSSSGAAKLSEIAQQAMEASQRRQTTSTTAAVHEAAPAETAETEARFADIEANTFYQIMFNPDINPEQRQEETARALTSTGEKEEDRQRLQEFALFKEYLQFERQRMAVEIIRLTDTEAFAELKQVYDDMNSAVLQFEKDMQPLVDILDATYKLRMGGLTIDAFREIKEDEAEEARRSAMRAEQAQRLQALQDTIAGYERDIAVLQQDTNWLGNIKKAARQEIARKQVDIETTRRQLETLTAEIEHTAQAPLRESALGALAPEKEKLRELLDITAEGHKQRQEALVRSAEEFVTSSRRRVSSVMDHLGGMNDQLDNLYDASSSMQEIYAIMFDASKQATEANAQLRNTLLPPEAENGQPAPEESQIGKMQRERKQAAVEDYMASLRLSTTDTASTLADLAAQCGRVKSMKDANTTQVAKTTALHSAGIAGVADRLSTVLQGISMAAVGEASEMAGLSLTRMRDTTNAINAREVFRAAAGVRDENDKLAQAIASLEAYGDVMKKATLITAEGIQESTRLVSEMQKQAEEIKAQIQESFAVGAGDIPGNDDAPMRSAPAADTGRKVRSPFKFGPRQ